MAKRTPQSRMHKISKRSIKNKNLQQARAAAWAKLKAYDSEQTTSKKSSSIEECEENLPQLETEVDSNYETIRQLLDCRRIVNLGHVLTEYERIIRHGDKCTMGKMLFVKETRFGLNSKLHFFCDNCKKSVVVCTDPDHEENSLTEAVVWGSLSIGIGKNQCEELFAIMDLPFMTQKTYNSKMSHIKKVWEKQMHTNMQSAGREERKIAIEKGNVCADGTPYITVIVDGGWSKRSYGHGYNAASGVGIIIGAETKKPLFLGVRNKTCSACSFYKEQNITPKFHNCALNYTGPSTGMEQQIIVEGFCKSLEHHGVIYIYLIGDGDSSVYAKVVEGVPYGRQVIKIECANHMTRCLNDKLHRLSKNTSFDISNRKILTKKVSNISNLERLVKSVRTIIKNNKNNAIMLRKDLANAPYHVFGSHRNCRDTFCTKKNSDEENLTEKLDGQFFLEILKILEPLVNKADRLSFNETTNQAERYMALVAKCTGGKRVNFSRSISYTVRAYGAAISHSMGPAWHLNTWRGKVGRSTENILNKRKRADELRKVNRPTALRRRKVIRDGHDFNYGPNAAQPDIDQDEMSRKKIQFLDELKNRASSNEKLAELENKTRGQHDNASWRQLRLDYLTSSNFGSVLRRKSTTPCHNLVKTLLYRKPLNTPAIVYGRVNECRAIAKYQNVTGVSVTRCGLFVDSDNPFLAASPDGLVGENGLIEVKCIQSLKGKLIEDSQRRCYTIKDNEIMLKRNHDYFFQVQGQLNICKKDYCDFIIYTDDDFHIERIRRDEILWRNVMLPKLTSFYMNSVLPEILDGRIPRGMRVREANE